MHAAVLRYFDQVARQGSIRRAAESLHVASSAVNRQIIKLEQETGTALFERLRTGVRLTAAGEGLLRHAAEPLTDYDRRPRRHGDLGGNRARQCANHLAGIADRALHAGCGYRTGASLSADDADGGGG